MTTSIKNMLRSTRCAEMRTSPKPNEKPSMTSMASVTPRSAEQPIEGMCSARPQHTRILSRPINRPRARAERDGGSRVPSTSSVHSVPTADSKTVDEPPRDWRLVRAQTGCYTAVGRVAFPVASSLVKSASPSRQPRLPRAAVIADVVAAALFLSAYLVLVFGPTPLMYFAGVRVSMSSPGRAFLLGLSRARHPSLACPAPSDSGAPAHPPPRSVGYGRGAAVRIIATLVDAPR